VPRHYAFGLTAHARCLPVSNLPRYPGLTEEMAMDFQTNDIEYQRHSGSPLLARLY